MGNALRVLKRDYLRLIKAPAALVVAIFLVVLPSLYTWFNVVGFWDPYGNTGNLRVCVVNEDQGAYADLTGDLRMGDQVMDALAENSDLGWVFTDRDTAMEEVESGKAYAAFIIPSDFSYDVTTFLTGDFVQPKLEYYVNEKAGGVSTKVTDTGASTLEDTINSTFVSTVSGTIAGTINTSIENAQDKIGTAQTSVGKQLDKAESTLQEARNSVADLNAAASELTEKSNSAKSKLESARSDIDNLSSQLQETSNLLVSTQNALGPFITSMSSAMDQSSALASKAATSATASVGKVNASVQGAQGTVQSAVDTGNSVIEMNKNIITSLDTLASTQGLDEDIKNGILQTKSMLEQQNETLQTTIDGVSASYDSLAKASQSISSATEKVNSAFQGTLSATDEYRSVLNNQTFPALNNGLTQLSNSLSELSTSVSNQQLLINQAMSALDQLNSALQTTAGALGDTDGLLASFQTEIDTVKTDLMALSASTALEDLFGEDGVNSDKIATFMSSPTKLQTTELYPVNAYGSAMAPLFMNMTLWIGVFMLLVILRQEVDSEGIANLTSRQRYLGKWLFLAPLVCLQAIVCCAGNLFLGVQVASVALFFLTSMFISLTYLCIQFMLAVLFQHIGKGICIIFIFVQIPGATGLYPIEMTPPFFQAVYPIFPFTYGINALREVIAGFYGMQWGFYMGMLALFLLVAFIGGLVFRPYLTNMNRMVSKQIAASDILNGEDADLPARRYRMNQLFRVLADREDYRMQLAVNAKKFMRWYPKLKRWAFILAFVMPCIVSPIMGVLGAEKVIVLTCWLAWYALTVFFLIALEYIRDRLAHEIALDDLSDDELASLFQARDGVSKAPAPTPVDLREGVR